MSSTSAQLSASAPGAHSRKPSSALATSFMGNWTSDDDLDNIGRQYSFCYNANFSKVGSQRYDAVFSELVSYQFEPPRSKKTGNARMSSWDEDARTVDLPSEDDVLDLADASKAKLLDVQSTNAAVGALEVTAADTSVVPASLAMPGSMTPISTSSSAADWLNDDRVWDGENTTPECAPTRPTHSIKQPMKDGKESFQPKFKPFIDSKPSFTARVTSGPGLGIMMTPTKSSEVYEAVVLASMASATSLLVPDKPRLTAVESDEDVHVSPFMLSHPSLVASVSFVVSSPLVQNAPEAPRLYHNRVDADSPTMSYTSAQMDAAQLVIQTPQHSHTSNMMASASAAVSSRSLQNAPKASRHHHARATADSPTNRYSSAQIDVAQLVKSPKFNLVSDITASVSFADSSPLLQNAPKAPRLYHAKVAMDSPTMNYSSAQIDAAQLVKTPEHIRRRRNVHGLRASMHYTNSTFDGPLDTPSKPSSHRTFLSSERMQIADLASRPQVFETPSKETVPDSPLLKDSPERGVLASSTSFNQNPSPEPNSPCIYASDPFDEPARSGPPVSPHVLPLASSLESSSLVTPQNKGSPSISMRIASPRVKTRYAFFASPTPLPSSSIQPIQRNTPQDDPSAKVELSTSSSLDISFPHVETIPELTEQVNHVSLVSNTSSLQENAENPSLNGVSSSRSLSDLFPPSGEPTFLSLCTSEPISQPVSSVSPASPHLPLPSSSLGPDSSVFPQKDVETRNMSLVSPHTSILASSIEPIHYAARNDASPRAELPTSTSLSFCFPPLKSIPETTEQVEDVPSLSPENVQNPVLDPLPYLPSPCNISPALGTTDSSLRISQSFEGLGLGLPSTLTSESLADKGTNEDSPLPDAVYSRENASGNTERANPRLPSELVSELISDDDHSISSDITLCDSIDSDQVERTTSVEDAAVIALLEALSSVEQQCEYDLLPSGSFMQLHRFPKRCLYDIPEAYTPPATPPTPLPASAHMPDASSYTNESSSLVIEQTPHAPSSSSTEPPHTSEASTSPQTPHISESSHSSSSFFRTSSQSSLSFPQTRHTFSHASENITKPKKIIKSVRSLAAPACLSSLTLKNQKQQRPSLAAINAAAHPEQPEQTPHTLSSLSPSESIIKPKNNIKPVRGLAASACLSSLTLKSEKQHLSRVVVDAPSQPSANTPLVASSSSKNIFKSVRRLAASAFLSSLTLKKQQPLVVNPATHPGNQPSDSEYTPQSFANTLQPSAFTPQPSTNIPRISSSKNNLKSARGPAASASLSSLPPKKQNQPQPPLVVTAESQPSSDWASPPLTTGLKGLQGKGGDGSNQSESEGEGSKSGAKLTRTRWPFNNKFCWTIFSTQAESEGIIPSPEMGSSNSPSLVSPCIIHEDVPRTTLGVNGDGGRGKGVLKFLF